MLLFVIYLNPLVKELEKICSGEEDCLTVYADDISIISSSPNKIHEVKDAIIKFGEEAGAKLNLET